MEQQIIHLTVIKIFQVHSWLEYLQQVVSLLSSEINSSFPYRKNLPQCLAQSTYWILNKWMNWPHPTPFPLFLKGYFNSLHFFPVSCDWNKHPHFLFPHSFFLLGYCFVPVMFHSVLLFLLFSLSIHTSLCFSFAFVITKNHLSNHDLYNWTGTLWDIKTDKLRALRYWNG